MQGNHLSIKDISNQKITLKVEDYEGKENVIIENLEGCVVEIPFIIKVLYIKNIKDTKI